MVEENSGTDKPEAAEQDPRTMMDFQTATDTKKEKSEISLEKGQKEKIEKSADKSEMKIDKGKNIVQRNADGGPNSNMGLKIKAIQQGNSGYPEMNLSFRKME